MHLTSIRLRGFKSFPDPVEVRLEPGVAVVVGPNGSGKSNIVDAIVWAAGSLSPSELRADRADDVLFAGSAGRQKADWCEVELLFDNSDGGFGELEFSELSIVRRLHRGGEGQYLINRAPVRRLDLVELLSDAGLGSGMHSIVGQGRVEAILASRPAERRQLVEEAAGLGRFKQRRHRAELKLARVAVDVDRARDLETEVRSRLRPLALQATAAERAQKLARRIASLEATRASLEAAEIEDRRRTLEERRGAIVLERRRVDRRLESVLAERQRAEDELADAAGRREQATAGLYRLRSAAERIALRGESAGELLVRIDQTLLSARPERTRPSLEELEQVYRDATREAAEAAVDSATLAERVRLARERLSALERSLEEREGLPPAARVLSDRGARLALDLLEVEPGYERAVAAALAWRASGLVAGSPEEAVALAEQARAEGLGRLSVLLPRTARASAANAARPLTEHVRARSGGELVLQQLEGVGVVESDELAAARTSVVVTREGHCFDPAGGELRYAGETAEAVLLELEARRRLLFEEMGELEVLAGSAEREAEKLSLRAERAGKALLEARPAFLGRPVDSASLGRAAAAARRLAGALEEAGTVAARLEAPLRARADAGSLRAGELAASLRRLGGEEAELRREALEAGERAASVQVELTRAEAELAAAAGRLEAAGEPPLEGEEASLEELAEKLARSRRRLEALGQVNPLAQEEYEREKERLDELSAQRADLERSLSELDRLRADLTDTVEKRFAETFAAVERNFREVAGTLFPGGEGRLRLTEPAEGEEGHEAGVEVELRPAGKRVTKLSLLSGGEKALGAIAFLFALFLARPCPFYLLDEVEAALDDANLGRFVELLRRYGERAQFIVVTHQKRTMEAADILYGVTMGAEGVSQVVSRRVPKESTEPAIALAGA